MSSGHVTLSGTTQYGISYFVKSLVESLLASCFYNLIHDPSHKGIGKKYHVVKSLKQLENFFKKDGTHCVYKPLFLDKKGLLFILMVFISMGVAM